jgi:serine/threonine-protein kinase
MKRPMAAANQAISSGADVLPRRFGRYQLFDRVGRGGMAEIFLARADTGLSGASRLLVVKQIHPQLSGDERFAKMFADEAKLCAGLRHANIVQIVDLGRAEVASGQSVLFMAMEYVEGLDLNQLLRRLSQQKVPLPLEFALFIVRETLSALDFAHRAKGENGKPLGIVHRDVSPSNVLMSLEGEVKLCDFGIARAFAEGGSDAAAAGAKVVGKSAYMSPEQARGEALDGRADVFAAGILLWELCAGRRLYRGSEDEMLALAKKAEIPALPDRGIPLQEKLQAVLDRALTADRDARFPDAATMRDALDGYAMEARAFASQLRFGTFLSDHFDMDLLAGRRERERAAAALEHGPPASLTPIEAAADGSAIKPIGSVERSPRASEAAEAMDTPVREPVSESAPVAMAAAPASVDATQPVRTSHPSSPGALAASSSSPGTAPTPEEDSDTMTTAAVVALGVLAVGLVGLAVFLYFYLG